jgi:hypothetical protein
MLQRTLPAGFITPCLPTKTDRLPSGSQWLHEIKHDGFRIIARKTGTQVSRCEQAPGGRPDTLSAGPHRRPQQGGIGRGSLRVLSSYPQAN